jgi:N-acetylmuramoyl-L-alanine amidase
VFGPALLSQLAPASRLTTARRITRALVVVITVVAFASANLQTACAQGGIAGMTIFVDPGHNAINDSSTTAQVPDGRGGTKQCITSGTSTPSGYPEHTFNWDVVQRISAALSDRGVHTVLSRSDDNSAGPCVDRRAAMANSAKPDAIVSIHADGGPPAGKGFHVNFSAPPLNDAQAGPAPQLATIMRDQLVASGMQPFTYIGSNGL